MIFLYSGLISWYRAVVTMKMNCSDLYPWKDDCPKTPTLSLCVYCHVCILAVFPMGTPSQCMNMMGFLAWCDMGLPNQQMLAPGHPLGWLKPPET